MSADLNRLSPALTLRSRLSGDMHAHREELIARCETLTSRVSGKAEVIGGRRVFIKGGPLPKSAARRHRWRGIFLGAPLPALAEFLGAEWLRERLFQTPEPLAAIEAHSRSRILGSGMVRLRQPAAQLFMTAAVPNSRLFQEAWITQTEDERERSCHELGTEVGRLHALHFLHADLYPRNVLVDDTPVGGRSLWFIDSWAGGPTAWRRGSLRRLESDLGTWLTEFEPGLDGVHLRTLLEAYVESRFQNGRPIKRLGPWLESIQGARRHELRRLERQRYRLRGAAFPQAGLALPTLP